MAGGVFNYAPLLLRAADFGLGPADSIAGGVLLCLGFLASLALLPPPESRAEFGYRLAACLSTTTGFALEQCNFDVALFILIALALPLLGRGSWARALAYATFLLAAALKFYPGALMFLAVRERWRQLLLAVGVSLATAALYLAYFWKDVVTAIVIIPLVAPFRATFGRIDVPHGLGSHHIISAIRMNHLLHHAIFTSDGQVVNLLSLAMTGIGLLASAKAARHYANRLKTLDTMRLLYLIGGCLVTVFCFYTVQNIYYRAIFLLFTLPGLWSMQPQDRRVKILLAILLFLLWEAIFRDIIVIIPSLSVQIVFWILREALWWLAAIELGGITLAFAIAQLAPMLGKAWLVKPPCRPHNI